MFILALATHVNFNICIHPLNEDLIQGVYTNVEVNMSSQS